MGRIQYDAADSNFSPLPDGTMDFYIEAAEYGPSKGGDPQVRLRTVVLNGESEGRKMLLFYTLTPKAAWSFQALVEALGLATDGQDTGQKNERGDAVTHYEFDTEDLEGLTVRFDVTSRPGTDGKIWNNYNSPRLVDPSTGQVVDPIQRAAVAPMATPPPAAQGFNGPAPFQPAAQPAALSPEQQHAQQQQQYAAWVAQQQQQSLQQPSQQQPQQQSVQQQVFPYAQPPVGQGGQSSAAPASTAALAAQPAGHAPPSNGGVAPSAQMGSAHIVTDTLPPAGQSQAAGPGVAQAQPVRRSRSRGPGAQAAG